ncbi:MAG: sugar phosphate isomerase/epimerase [Clostridia bacterium]|nr:sugar phosphate isomerase/epimerase [Clostridia bacterium]
MKIAFSTLGCPDWNWDIILATAKDMGFDGIEIRGIANEIYAPKIPVFQESKISDSINKLDRMGLNISCLTSACYLYDKQTGDRMIAEGKEYIDLADALGVPFVRVLGDKDPQPGKDIDDEYVAIQVKKLCSYAENRNVTVLIETNGVYADSARMKRLLELTDEKSLGVLWDVHHPYRYFNETPEKTYSVLGDRIRYLHVKDSVVLPDGKLKYRMMGYGDVPLKETFRILKENGYDGYVTLEWVKRWYSELEEPGVVFMQFRSYVNRMLRH